MKKYKLTACKWHYCYWVLRRYLVIQPLGIISTFWGIRNYVDHHHSPHKIPVKNSWKVCFQSYSSTLPASSFSPRANSYSEGQIIRNQSFCPDQRSPRYCTTDKKALFVSPSSWSSNLSAHKITLHVWAHSPWVLFTEWKGSNCWAFSVCHAHLI